MAGLKKKARGGAFTFRVSDVVQVPLRGTMLRLRVQDGSPSIGDVGVGSVLRLADTAGHERRVVIGAHSVTGGNQTQERLDRTRELDVIVSDQETGSGIVNAEIGWTAAGPV